MIYYVGYFSAASLGLWNPVFSSLLLLDIFRRSPLLSSILMYLYRPRYQIMLTLILFIIMTYFFTIIFYFFYYDDYSPICNSLWICFAVIFDQTFKNNAGFITSGDLQPETKYDQMWSFNSRVIYDFLYIFFVIILILEIISGNLFFLN